MKFTNKKKFFLFFFSIVFFIFLIFLFFNNASKNIFQIENTKYVKTGGQTIKVETVSTPEMQEKGLSGKNILKENEGMLFVFNHQDKYSFWMKDMNFPIDIIWLAPPLAGQGEGLQVVYIKKDAKPESFPEIFKPNRNSKYVLEVVSGFSEKNNLKVGDNAEFLP